MTLWHPQKVLGVGGGILPAKSQAEDDEVRQGYARKKPSTLSRGSRTIGSRACMRRCAEASQKVFRKVVQL